MKNMVYIQSGGPTSVINTSFYGAVKEALKHPEEIDGIYGSLNGIEGMIDDRLIDIININYFFVLYVINFIYTPDKKRGIALWVKLQLKSHG